MFCLQEIKRDNTDKGTVSCKIALYRTFLKCGVRTWEQVMRALEKSDHGNIAEEAKVQLVENYINVIIIPQC